MEMIRQKVYQLEQAQLKMKQEFVPPTPTQSYIVSGSGSGIGR